MMEAAVESALRGQPSTEETLMPHVLIRSKVQDFAKWKGKYDEHLNVREAAGLTERYLLRNADNPNEVIMLFEASDLDKARALASSSDLRQRMQEAGVADKPDIYFLT
jgi:hypothetical protein